MRRASPLLFAVAVLLGAACATTSASSPAPAPAAAVPAQPPPPPPDPDAPLKKDVQALREAAAGLLQAQAELTWKSWALGEAVDYSAAAKGREALFAPDAYAKVKALREKTKDPGQERALRALELYLAGEQVARATSDSADAVAHLAATSMFSVEGQEFSFRELEVALANEGHTGKRRKIYQAAGPVVRKLEVALSLREKKLAEAVSALGYPNPLAFEAAQRRVDDPATLSALAEQVLTRTEASYSAALQERCKKELALDLKGVRRSDIPRIMRTGDVDTFFPKEKSLEVLTSLLARMGLDSVALPQLKLDGAPQLRRNPRALAVSVVAGKDVRLSLRPASGLGAAAQAFHEAGHAVQAAATKGEVAEFAALGSGAVAEAAGYLLEDVLDDPPFVETLGVPPAKLAAHAKVSALRKLLQARRLAGRLLFEISWRSGTLQGKPEDAYREIMARALGFPADPEDGARWLTDNDDDLAAADHLRGLLAAAQLRAALSSEFGPKWWSDAKAGARLAGWFAPGSQPTIEQLVQSAGSKALDVEPFAAGLEALLATPPAAPAKAGP
ncbi:MAG TPA: hypothetical protein VGK67_20710 [Myxococcales bacterium]|jgi:hypothetical protein